MEKILLCLRVYRPHGQKFWKTMKLFIFLMCCFTFSLSANSFAQQEKVNLDLRDVSIKTLFSEIQRQTKLHFIFSSEQANRLDKLTVKATDETVKSVLDRIFEGTGFTYTFRDDIIMVRFEGEKTVRQAEKEMEIRGVVKDKNGEPLPGVTVLVGGTTLGTATDAKGEFLLKVPEQESVALHFSFVGMKTQELVFKKGQKPLAVVMEEDSENIEEIVVTGYQQIEKRNLTSSVVTVKTSELQTIGASSIEQMLQGVVPGLSVVNTSASPGAAPKIRIRGTATISGNADPLWVLDGVILENSVPVTAADLNSPDVMNMFNSVIGGINPNDIESITVLKDASATAIYGTRAANGVIVVTTKKGKANSFNISYQHTSTVSIRPFYDNFDLLNSKERVAYSRELVEKRLSLPDIQNYVGYEDAINKLLNGVYTYDQFQQEVDRVETVNTDWFKLITEDTFSHNHTLSLSGGSDNVSYYASLGYSNENGVIKKEKNDRYSTLLKVNGNFDKLAFNFMIQANRGERHYTNSEIDILNYAYNTARTIPAFNEDGSLYYYKKSYVHPKAGQRLDLGFNALNEMANCRDEYNTYAMTVTTDLNYRFNENLKAQFMFSYGMSNTTQETVMNESSWYAASLRGTDYGVALPDEFKTWSLLPMGGEYREDVTRNDTYTARLQLDYNKFLDKDHKHLINASVGFEVSSNKYAGKKQTHRGYLPERGKIITTFDPSVYTSFAQWQMNTAGELSLITRRTSCLLI